MIVIGVDAGRSGIKAISLNGTEKKRRIFDSKYTHVNFLKLKHHPVLDFNKDDDIIAKVDNGDPIGYGNVCTKIAPPAEIQFVSDDEIYLEKSINYTLVAIAKMTIEHNEEVILGIDLTTNNIDQESKVIEKIKGKHEVVFYNTMGKELSKKIFTVKKVGCWYQCWIGFMSQAINEDFSINLEWAEKEVLAIDIGRRTVICQYISYLSPVDNFAFNCGSEAFFNYLQEELKFHFDIKKNTQEIEKMIKNNKSFSKAGKIIDITKAYVAALKRYEDILKNSILEHFGKYDPEKIVFMGGGALLFQDILSQMYNNAVILEDPLFRNADGLVKLVGRKFLENKRGLN